MQLLHPRKSRKIMGKVRLGNISKQVCRLGLKEIKKEEKQEVQRWRALGTG